MLTLSDIFIWLLLILGALLVWRRVAVREMALSSVKRHLHEHHLQLLDDNVALRGFWFKRNAKQKLSAWYSYTFEFSSTGYERYQGKIVILGGRVTNIELDPYRLPDAEDLL